MPRVGFALGVAPENAAKLDADAKELLRERAHDRFVCAIGSCGPGVATVRELDAFRFQIEVAVEVGLPLVVEAAGAYDCALEVLQDVGMPQAGVLVRAFDGTGEELQRWDSAGCWVSFDARAANDPERFMRLARAVAPERVLVESGAPGYGVDALAGYDPRADQVVFVADALREVCAPAQLAKNTIAFFGL